MTPAAARRKTPPASAAACAGQGRRQRAPWTATRNSGHDQGPKPKRKPRGPPKCRPAHPRRRPKARPGRWRSVAPASPDAAEDRSGARVRSCRQQPGPQVFRSRPPAPGTPGSRKQHAVFAPPKRSTPRAGAPRAAPRRAPARAVPRLANEPVKSGRYQLAQLEQTPLACSPECWGREPLFPRAPRSSKSRFSAIYRSGGLPAGRLTTTSSPVRFTDQGREAQRRRRTEMVAGRLMSGPRPAPTIWYEVLFVRCRGS